MQTEYGAESRLETAPWRIIRWATPEAGTELNPELLPTGARLAYDASGHPVILFVEEWSCNFFAERNPKIQLSALPVEAEAAPA